MKDRYNFEDFLEIIKILRSENGCPWDKVQTHETLRQSMIEEAYEAVEAINNGDIGNLKEELGDVLLQVVFHAQIESEKGNFNMDDVIDNVSKKMVSRHTHIFGKDKADTPEEVLETWEKNKKKEKGYETQTEVLKSVPKALPSLTRARKVQSKAADVSFDFEKTEEVWKKVEEEKQELYDAVFQKKGNIEEEFGDLLFTFVNLSRFLQINPDFALTKATEKFINRFEIVENTAFSKGKELSEMSLEELDALWREAKATTQF